MRLIKLIPEEKYMTLSRKKIDQLLIISWLLKYNPLKSVGARSFIGLFPMSDMVRNRNFN